MCIQNTLQQHILDITNDGKDVADFLYATMHGLNPNAKFHHQFQAAKHLTKLALDSITVRPEPRPELAEGPVEGPAEEHAQQDSPSPSTGEGRDGGDRPVHAEPVEEPAVSLDRPTENSKPITHNSQLTDLDIINYKVARLIREETNDGYLIAEFLSRVMHGTAGQGRPISEADRIRAATELMNRGLGRFGDTRDRRVSNTHDDHELINSGLARYIRERTDQGLEPAYFLLDVASGRDEGFTMHQRVTATRELIRRGWDTNYDAITPEDITAYYERQEAREPTGYDNRLQEWREQQKPAGATGRSPEDEPQLEAGIFAHLSFDEIDRYEAMSAEEQAEFVEKQRQYRAARRSAAPHEITPSSSSQLVIPAQAGIQGGVAGSEDRTDTPSPSTGESRDGGDLPASPEPRPEFVEGLAEGHAQQDSPSPSQPVIPAEAGIQRKDGRETPQNTNRNTLYHDAPSASTPHPTHPVHPVTSQPHIRSP